MTAKAPGAKVQPPANAGFEYVTDAIVLTRSGSLQRGSLCRSYRGRSRTYKICGMHVSGGGFITSVDIIRVIDEVETGKGLTPSYAPGLELELRNSIAVGTVAVCDLHESQDVTHVSGTDGVFEATLTCGCTTRDFTGN